MAKTILENLLEKRTQSLSVTVRTELEYRIFILSLQKVLCDKVSDISSLEEALDHRNCVWRMADFMARESYNQLTEGDDETAFRTFTDQLYYQLRQPFRTIVDYREYGNNVHAALNRILKKWWEYRQGIMKL